MNHGLVACDSTFGAAVWQMAMERCEWPVLYMSRSFEIGLEDHSRQQRPPGFSAAVRAAFTRSIGVRGGVEFARYEPDTQELFSQMCRTCAIKIDFAIAVPSDVLDVTAMELYDVLDSADAKVVEACIQGRKIRKFIQDVAIHTRWAFLTGFLYEDPSTVFLAEDAQTIDQVETINCLRDDYRTSEKW